MPILTSQINIEVIWDRVTGNFDITLLPDLAALGLDPVDVTVAFRIFGPAGVIYLNPFYTNPVAGPDIDADVSLNNTSIPFPVDMAGDILEGEYTFDIAVGIVSDGVYTNQALFTFDFDIPALSIAMEAQCEASRLTTTVSPNEPVGATRELLTTTLNYPAAAGSEDPEGTPLPVVFTTTTKVSNPIAQGTYVAVSSSRYLYKLGDAAVGKSEFFIRYTQSANKTFQVDCTGLCEFYCQIAELYRRYYACAPAAQSERQRLSALIIQATGLWLLLRESVNCNKPTDRVLWETKLTELLGDCDCNCEEDDSIWITNVYASGGISGSSYSFEAGPGLDVDVTEEGVVTYEIEASLLASIAALISDATGLAIPGLLECDGVTGVTGTLGTLLQRFLNQIIPRSGTTTCPVTGVIEMATGTGFKLMSGGSPVIEVAFVAGSQKLLVTLAAGYLFEIFGNASLKGKLIVTGANKTTNFVVGTDNTFSFYIAADSGDIDATLFNTAGGVAITQEIVYLKRIDNSANVVTVIPDAGYTIDGQANYDLKPRESIRVNWRSGTTDFAILSSHYPKELSTADPVPGEWNVVGKSGQPAFEGSAANASPILGRPTTAFRAFLSHLQLRGVVDPGGSIATTGGNLSLFTIADVALRPIQIFEVQCGMNLDEVGRELKIVVNTSGVVFLEANGGSTYPYTLPFIYLNNIMVPLT